MKRRGGKSSNAVLLVDFVQRRAIKNKGEERIGLKKVGFNEAEHVKKNDRSKNLDFPIDFASHLESKISERQICP